MGHRSSLCGKYGGPVDVPKEILERVGKNNWAMLSFALHHGWIEDFKYFRSIKEGRHINAAEAARMMVDPNDEDGLYLNQKEGNRDDICKLFAIGYLLRTDFVSSWEDIPDEHGSNQLEGELKRFEAERISASPHQIRITREIASDYCRKYNLEEALQNFLVKLKI